MRQTKTMNKLMVIAALIATIGGVESGSPVHANPLGPHAPVCRAVVGDKPYAHGLYVVANAGVDCLQQADQLRWVATLQFQREGQSIWSRANEDGSEKTFPLHMTLPLGARCEEGFWRTQVEIWQKTAGVSDHGLFYSAETIAHKSDCHEDIHIF